MMEKVIVIGAGLAGSEACWQLAQRGIPVELHEMRPGKSTPAHKSAGFAELICSNSLRANNVENAVGLLKEEMRRCDSLILAMAVAHSVPCRWGAGSGSVRLLRRGDGENPQPPQHHRHRGRSDRNPR